MTAIDINSPLVSEADLYHLLQVLYDEVLNNPDEKFIKKLDQLTDEEAKNELEKLLLDILSEFTFMFVSEIWDKFVDEVDNQLLKEKVTQLLKEATKQQTWEELTNEERGIFGAIINTIMLYQINKLDLASFFEKNRLATTNPITERYLLEAITYYKTYHKPDTA